MAYLQMPQRVFVVSEQPQHDISHYGCFSNATTCCGRFFRHWAFSIFERNIYTRECRLPLWNRDTL